MASGGLYRFLVKEKCSRPKSRAEERKHSFATKVFQSPPRLKAALIVYICYDKTLINNCNTSMRMEVYLCSQAWEITPHLSFDKKKTVAFIGTAGNVYQDPYWVKLDRIELEKKGLKITDVEIENHSLEELAEILRPMDIIFVAGGNTFYLLQKAKESGFDKVVQNLQNTDKIYIGSSAGSILACKDIEYISPMDEPEKVPDLKEHSAIGLFPKPLIVHADKEKYQPAIQEIKAAKNSIEFLEICDNQALHFYTNSPEKFEILSF